MAPGLVATENLLEAALLRARAGGDVTDVVAALAGAEVYLPSLEAPEGKRELVAQDGDGFLLPLLDVDGARFIPVYSSLERLAQAYPEGAGYAQVPGRGLAAVRPPEVGIVLDPGTELTLMLVPEDVESLGEIEAESGYAIGEPKEEPQELLDAARRALEGRDDIVAAYRALLVHAPSRRPEPVIGLAPAEGVDPRAALEAVAAAATEAGVTELALLALGAEPTDPVGGFLVERTKPFWTRGKAG
jgi:SseB protein N-terminal domain/SseB protein C-terminal domain